VISIIVPAYNESSVIARALGAITAGAKRDEIEVIVVCNGCTDDTASIAREFGPPIQVIETSVGNKTHALNVGDKAARSFPRIYADADVVISLDAIRTIATRLEHGDALAVAPFPSINLVGCSYLVRAYFEIRSRLPSAKQGFGGSGVYALSEAGRRRFNEFPSLTADDGYIRIQFRPEERDTLPHATSIVFAPRTLKDLILVRTRAYYGSLELAGLYPDLWENKGESNHRTLTNLLKFPLLWPKISIYLLVNMIARYRAAIRYRTRTSTWDRDDTSRRVITVAPSASGDRTL
jgi:glycosyltransferase involved in cell wall biosynthesis